VTVSKRIVFLNPGEYFQGAVSGAVASLKADVSEHAQVYLVQLLNHYINMDNFYPTDAEGNRADTLTQQLAVALEQETAEQKAKRLRQLGDFSLYVSGFFTDSLSRKLVDVDYYMGMGGAAYENVARLEERRPRAKVFMELAQKFPRLVDILAQISEETGFNPGDHKDLLRTYDLWVKTGSDRLAKQLAKAGIVPAAVKVPKASGDDS
jgi:hypothetical protein